MSQKKLLNANQWTGHSECFLKFICSDERIGGSFGRILGRACRVVEYKKTSRDVVPTFSRGKLLFAFCARRMRGEEESLS